MSKKNGKLEVTFPAFGRVLCILRSLDVRADVGHREALVLFACAGRTLPEILLTLVKGVFLSAVEAHVLSRADFLSCGVGLLFGQSNHQTFHSALTYL